ncbi:TPM domain-containing protein [Desertifilum sp. FACHB-1129]|uniref:Methanol dehydrogenase n=1 Tax=Desertifilum tharense IPPAS B-1220 TaxID=1781255 RepID=A0A1E5QD18_9CYAN|nr:MULTISPECIES: TPM domain-containing protein [Cyanophyceae]MCD8489175.1 TPM domain-containing protein [Desertifilum sp.]MDA0213494.1 TPM domain-containing protein [Cyanobacteria bacterium FC1]MBD2311395.1 TPM domain-containing protein [Desertifilum sp. FACHB-1129]MBD2321641.1 TPM domain-containing protein [Desertifilum sp. FACHB-866]MBD2331768.1 TPM domain-containing protein [Desertifilum sp. FACHB-868]
MPKLFFQRLFVCAIALLLTVSVWGIAPQGAQAVDNPELLPDTPTPIIDLGRALTDIQEDRLAEDLSNFESETGWKLRVLTQFDRTPGRAVKDFWGLDDKSVLLVADSRGGNLLNFNVGDEVYALLPRTFWIELQTRYGNQFFVRENGEDQSILQSLESVKTCLRQGGCQVVPGLPREQWILTLITSLIGGVVCGFAAQPRKPGQLFAWQWALIFSPLWGILFIAFGVGPVVARTTEWLPLFRNVIGFLLGFLVAYLSPMLNRPEATEL